MGCVGGISNRHDSLLEWRWTNHNNQTLRYYERWNQDFPSKNEFPVMKSCRFLNGSSKFCRYFCDKSCSNETKNFDKLANSWWNLKGPFYALHSMNEVRIPWIVDTARHINSKKSELPLEGLKILDVGCGGGILSVVWVDRSEAYNVSYFCFSR